MENNKYFIPNIEDLCIGYEFEYQGFDKKWHKVVYHINSTDKLNFIYINPTLLLEYINNKTIRVSYLTKEQIEAEGWKHSEKNCFDFNDRWMCSWYPEHNRVEFYDNENENGFAGNCKDINTFRKLIKLLGI
jgi:hypothetical protein